MVHLCAIRVVPRVRLVPGLYVVRFIFLQIIFFYERMISDYEMDGPQRDKRKVSRIF